MLCPRCRRQAPRRAAACPTCGAWLEPPPPATLELVLEEGTRVPVLGDLLIGRAPGSDLRIDDPSISRSHARISSGNGVPRLEDAGSSHGTFLDGTRIEGTTALHDGARIQLGNRILLVERVRERVEAGRTIVVPIGASLFLPSVGDAALADDAPKTTTSDRPRLRSGHRIKRLSADEGPQRWVVQDEQAGAVVRLADPEGELLEMLDGRRSIPELVAFAERRLGTDGPGRLARLLADLSDRGLLAGIDGTPGPDAGLTGWRARLGPRDRSFPWIGRAFERAYRGGGWVLFTRPAAVVLALIAACGAVAAGYLVARRYGSPFVVASHLGLGGLVFLAGRFTLVAFHETAHGLALASHGRKVTRAGLRLLLVFPYAFVDTSESWFEPRRNRIAVSLAGPASDLVLGGLFSILCLVLPAGTARDILFQLAFAAYVGAFFNLNPFLDRDGYHVMVDVLGRPRLRERARAQLSARLSKGQRGEPDRALQRYAIAGAAWSVVGAGFAILLSLRYEPLMERFAPPEAVWIVLSTVWIALFVPVILTIGVPLLRRRAG